MGCFGWCICLLSNTELCLPLAYPIQYLGSTAETQLIPSETLKKYTPPKCQSKAILGKIMTINIHMYHICSLTYNFHKVVQSINAPTLSCYSSLDGSFSDAEDAFAFKLKWVYFVTFQNIFKIKRWQRQATVSNHFQTVFCSMLFLVCSLCAFFFTATIQLLSQK